MAEVKRRKGESFESLLRRFSRRIQQSGRLLEARKYRFHTPELSKSKKRASALRRLAMGAKREYLMKIGQFVEDPKKSARRRSF